MNDEIPTIIGAAGLTGRQQVVRVPDLDDLAEEEAVLPVGGRTMPPSCTRCLQLGRSCLDAGALGFSGACQGLQRDGSCLAELVRGANAAGVDWAFEVVQEGDRVWWDYVGAPIPEQKES